MGAVAAPREGHFSARHPRRAIMNPADEGYQLTMLHSVMYLEALN